MEAALLREQRHDGQPGIAARPLRARAGGDPRRRVAHLPLRERVGLRAGRPRPPPGADRGRTARWRSRRSRRPSTLPAHNYHFYHYAPPGVICLENTHNRCGGTVAAARVLRRGRGPGGTPRPPGAPRRRAPLQRRGRGRPAGDRLDAARVVGAAVPVEGAGGAGRVDDLRIARRSWTSAADAEDARRRHAAGRASSRRRASSRSPRWWTGSPKTTRTPASSPTASRGCPAWLSTRRGWTPTSSSSGCPARAAAEAFAGALEARGRPGVQLRRRPPAGGHALRDHRGRLPARRGGHAGRLGGRLNAVARTAPGGGVSASRPAACPNSKASCPRPRLSGHSES